MNKICVVVSTPMTAKAFLTGHMKALARSREVCLVANYEEADRRWSFGDGIRSIHIPITRKIALLADVRALIRLYLLFRRSRFDVVHSVTPKAGLLAMLAARGARVPLRFHTFTGQVWATRTGITRQVLKMLDRVIYSCATEVLVDSPSQREFLLAERVIEQGRSSVLADGSISGVDLDRFRSNADARMRIRCDLGLPEKGYVFLFLGRLHPEKGIDELIAAFNSLAAVRDDAFLLLVGPEEGGGAPIGNASAAARKRIIRRGYTSTPEQTMAAADVFCLPSHREGFGSVVIEAAAVGIPSIGSRIYGISDAIVDGVTGLLHEVGNAADLHRCMNTLIADRTKAAGMGAAARERAKDRFSRDRVEVAMVTYYEERGV